jgi:xylulokinase
MFIDPGLADRLPAIESSRKAVGLLRDELRKKWGLSQNPVVSAGGGDNMMGAIGTGNILPGSATVMLGSCGTLYSSAEEPVVDPRGEVAAFCDSNDRWLPLVCTMNVSVATEQVRKLFSWSLADLDKVIGKTPAGSDGLIFLPYLNGERTPNLPKGTGIFHGLTTRNMTPGHLARAVMEGVTLGLAYGLARFRELGIKPEEIRLTGGGSKSSVWRKIAADIFGLPTVCLTSAEGAALGAAVQACRTFHTVNGENVRLGEIAARLVKLDSSTRAKPAAKHSELYASVLDKFTDLTRKLQSGGHL